MCGDMDEDGSNGVEALLYDRYVSHARALLAHQERHAGQADGIVATIDRLFTDALARALKDSEAADPDIRYEMLAMQPLVFARLAGLLAAHLSLQEDPLRRVMEAMMHGYAEAETVEPDHGHDHPDDGGPDHRH